MTFGRSACDRTAPTRGAFRVHVDGIDAGVVDLHSKGEHYQIVVFSRSWPSVGTHTIRMVALGSAGHPRVDLDAIAILR